MAHLLVVDDEKDIVELISRFAEHEGAAVGRERIVFQSKFPLCTDGCIHICYNPSLPLVNVKGLLQNR